LAAPTPTSCSAVCTAAGGFSIADLATAGTTEDGVGDDAGTGIATIGGSAAGDWLAAGGSADGARPCPGSDAFIKTTAVLAG
jgi:hypothetical protein